MPSIFKGLGIGGVSRFTRRAINRQYCNTKCESQISNNGSNLRTTNKELETIESISEPEPEPPQSSTSRQ